MASETTSVLSFPSYVRHWPHPGVASSLRKRSEFDDMNTRANQYARQLMNQGNTQQEAGRLAYQKFCDKKLFTYSRPEITEVYGMDGITYEEACDYVEKEVLPQSLAKTRPRDIEKAIQEIHKRILDPSHVNLQVPLGYYRPTGEMIVWKQFDKVNRDTPLSAFLEDEKKKAKGTDQEKVFERQIKYEKEIEKAVKAGNTFSDILNKKLVSKEAIQLLQEYVAVFPDSKNVPRLMKQFYENLSKKLNENKEDVISIACWAHLEFVRIHPFTEANGRMARMLMNIILMQGGHQPIAFALDSPYTAALRKEDAGEAGAFERLIRRLVPQFDYEAKPVPPLKYELVNWT